VLLALPASSAIVYLGKVPVWVRWSCHRTDVYTYDCSKHARVEAKSDDSEKFAALLDAESFVTVPVFARGQGVGRLIVTARKRGAFHKSDVDFLLQVVTHIMPVIDNIRLVDRLASEAANEERRRIARDIHDSVIQPYIGLQIGLGALRQQCPSSAPQLKESVDRLLQMTDVGVKDLRRYVLRLKTSDQHEDSLLAAVQRFTAKFSEATGIQVQVESEGNTAINDRLAAEVFQMVAEGLSNVRRHTRASCALIGLACRNGHLTLRIQNDGEGDTSAGPFTPRSITERAQALGGQVLVDENGDGVTQVTVDIPL
jgi:signal transduction histidine kinase